MRTHKDWLDKEILPLLDKYFDDTGAKGIHVYRYTDPLTFDEYTQVDISLNEGIRDVSIRSVEDD